MDSLYLKCVFDDGTVYFKLDAIDGPDDEYIYDGLELIFEDGNHWETDEYELTAQDLKEMYEDGFSEIERKEFNEAHATAKGHIEP